MPTQEIERIATPTRAEFYRKYATPNKPVVLTDPMDVWQSRAKWSFDWFRKEHGQVEVFVNTGTYDNVMTRKTSTLGEYVNSLFADSAQGSGYLSNIDLFKLIPGLAADVEFPKYEWLNRLTLHKFWMSRTGQFTQLHCDFGHNLVGQVVGRKRFQLYSPDVSSRLFPANTGWAGSFSQIDFKDADPKMREAAQDVLPDYDVYLEPGELLFLPYGWWHRVITEEAAIGVNLWWWTPKMLLTRGPMLMRELGVPYVKKRIKRTLKLAPAAQS